MALDLSDQSPRPSPAPTVEATIQNFKTEVIDASFHQIVLIDFWAEWCGPCKQLTPILEAQIAATRGAVKLVKINIDQQKMLAGQFQVKSIPMVYAVMDGRPVDGFMGVQPASQVKAFIDRLIQARGASATADADQAEDIEAALAEAHNRVALGDYATANEIFAAILEMEPQHEAATVGLLQLKLAQGDTDGAKAHLAGLPDALIKKPAIAQLQASLALAGDFTPLADPAAIAARLNSNPKDHEAAYALAGHAIARGDMDVAAQFLLGIISQARDWNDGEARKTLLRLFEAMGQMSEFTSQYRRKLSAILFS